MILRVRTKLCRVDLDLTQSNLTRFPPDILNQNQANLDLHKTNNVSEVYLTVFGSL